MFVEKHMPINWNVCILVHLCHIVDIMSAYEAYILKQLSQICTGEAVVLLLKSPGTELLVSVELH